MSTPRQLFAPLVGSRPRPPAAQVLGVLAAGTPLVLRPEPENPYDPKAIAVGVSLSETFPLSRIGELAVALAGTGADAVELVSSPDPLALGYIADSDGKPLAKRREAGMLEVGNREVTAVLQAPLAAWAATLAFAADGHPLVRIRASEGGFGE